MMKEVADLFPALNKRYKVEDDFLLIMIRANIERHLNSNYNSAIKCYERAAILAPNKEKYLHIQKHIEILKDKISRQQTNPSTIDKKDNPD